MARSANSRNKDQKILYTGFTVILVMIHIILSIPVGYLVFLTLVSWKASREGNPVQREPSTRFLILIPAHNEEILLPVLLKNLQKLNYPGKLYSVYVIADNCTDHTALAASDEGATVLYRINDSHRGKGYALSWGFQQIEASGVPFDAVVVLDADSTVSSNFLMVMDRYLIRGERVIQAYYAVQNPAEKWTGGIRYAAFTGIHFLRPLAREILRASVGLKGNGMVFCADVLRQNTWSGSLTEDIDFHIALVLKGERVAFAREAIVWGEMPNSLEKSRSQHARWERGRLQMMKKYTLRLLWGAYQSIRQKNFRLSFRLLDTAMELLIPPVSILVAAISMIFFVDCAWPFGISLKTNGVNEISIPLLLILPVLSLALLLGVSFYIISGLRLAKAPGPVYRSLLMAPRYLLWKVRQYGGITIHKGNENDRWIRTTRN